MKTFFFLLSSLMLLLLSCSSSQEALESSATYLANPDTVGLQTGGIRMIDIQTPAGPFKVWTKRVGNNPTKKLLLLHGGPGGTHELFECFDSFFPQEGIEYYYYDQLGSYYSDQPQDSSLWQTERFVEEVEQVRQALGLNKDNFYLLGHSWGGILAMEYALKYQQHLKGMIISNMMASVPAYNQYAAEVLGPQMDPQVLAELKDIEARQDFDNPRYMELLTPHFYTKHVLRMPIEEWPEPANRMFKHMNPTVYVLMQGYSEFGITGDARLKEWDRTADLPEIRVPTLTIGGAYDTMDPGHMEWVAGQVQQGRYLHCPSGSHCAMYDDQKRYFSGLIRFIHEVDKGTFAKGTGSR
jgi:proline iminopeptidase